MGEELFTTEEVAKRYRVHPKTIIRWVREGRLSGIKLGNAPNCEYRFTKSDLAAFEAQGRR